MSQNNIDNFKQDFNNLFDTTIIETLRFKVSQYYYTLFKSNRIKFLDWLQLFIFKNEVPSLLNQYIHNHTENLSISERKAKLNVLQYWLNERKNEISSVNIKETQKDIIDLVNHDLNYTLILLNQQLKRDEYLSYVIAGNRPFINYEKIGIYLRNLPSNLSYLNNVLIDFLSKIDKIISLHNNELKDLEERTRNSGIHYFLDFEEDGFSSLSNNIKCLRINDFNVSTINLTTRDNRVRFANEYNFEIIDSHELARRCNMIMQRITGYLNINSLEEKDRIIADRQIKLGNISNRLNPENLNGEDERFRKDIFKTHVGFIIYDSLHLTFKNGNNKLADYSYLFHKLKYDNFILHSVTSSTFLGFLHDEGIEIYKIKSLKEIGNITLRDDAYNRAKNSTI